MILDPVRTSLNRKRRIIYDNSIEEELSVPSPDPSYTITTSSSGPSNVTFNVLDYLEPLENVDDFYKWNTDFEL